MPVAALKSMSKKAEVSPERGERVYKVVKKATLGKKPGVKDKWAYTMGAVKKALKIESVLTEITKGRSITSALDDLINSDNDPISESSTFTDRDEAHLDETHMKLFFDSHGELKFSTPDGVQIHERTHLMNELSAIVDISSADSGIVEMMDGYEGTPSDLHDLITDRYEIVRNG